MYLFARAPAPALRGARRRGLTPWGALATNDTVRSRGASSLRASRPHAWSPTRAVCAQGPRGGGPTRPGHTAVQGGCVRAASRRAAASVCGAERRAQGKESGRVFKTRWAGSARPRTRFPPSHTLFLRTRSLLRERGRSGGRPRRGASVSAAGGGTYAVHVPVLREACGVAGRSVTARAVSVVRGAPSVVPALLPNIPDVRRARVVAARSSATSAFGRRPLPPLAGGPACRACPSTVLPLRSLP